MLCYIILLILLIYYSQPSTTLLASLYLIVGKYCHLQEFYLLIVYPVIDQQTEANYYLSKAIVYSSS